jgi:hypothetical protein
MNFVFVKIDFALVKMNFAVVKINFMLGKMNFGAVKINSLFVKNGFCAVSAMPFMRANSLFHLTFALNQAKMRSL